MRPTPIQAQAIPQIATGHDLIGCAQTGTGKTAAFVLPILHRLLNHPAKSRPRALIIAPTRELALQSTEHLKSLSKYVPLIGTAIFGGVPMAHQQAALRRGVDIISATPGRLLDHVYSGLIDFGGLEIFVLDEADRMLDMGFLPDIQKIERLLPKARQTLLFSATMPAEIQVLARTIMHEPVVVQIGQRSTTPAGIRHAIYPVPHHLKTDLLLRLLRANGLTSALVFSRTKHGADRLARHIERSGFNVSVLHSDRSQSQRLRALEKFRGGRSQILVATDIAARGIDIEDISHVINFDMPGTPEDYVHRIGRTARAEATGDAFTLMAPDEEQLITDIERTIGKSLPRVTLPDFDYRRPGMGGGGGHHGGHRPQQSGHRRRPGGHGPSGGSGHGSGHHRQGRHHGR